MSSPQTTDLPMHPFAASLKPEGDDVAVARYLISSWCYAIEQRDERIWRMENALRSIAANSCCDRCREAALIAVGIEP
jgi:hypothetical protein